MNRVENSTSFKKGHIGLRGNKNPNWKGSHAGYGAKHDWIRRWYGAPHICESCKTCTSKKYDWANISGKYLRNRRDWKRLCRPCHHLMDNRGVKTWITRLKKYGRICLKCELMTTSKHQLCPIHLKKMFNIRRSIRA